MADDSVLSGRVRELMKVGKLPRHRPARLWGGPGSGESCAVCGKTIGTGEVEMELQFTSEGGTGTGNYHTHARRFAVWERELQNEGANGHSLPEEGHEGIMTDRERNATNQRERG
jgi:hypothetical protein